MHTRTPTLIQKIHATKQKYKMILKYHDSYQASYKRLRTFFLYPFASFTFFLKADIVHAEALLKSTAAANTI